MYTKTRISALVLAIVMVASLFAAFPAIASAADTWTETYSSEIGDMVVSGPTSVTAGETFEITFTANNFTYTQAGVEGVQGYEIEFFIDTRYVIYDTTYDTALNEVTPPWTVQTELSSNWEYTANGLTAKAYEEATDKSTASMKKIAFGLGTMDPAADGLLAGDELTVTLRLKAVADGSAAFSFGCLYFSDIDWNPYYVYEYEGPCSYVVTVGDTTTDEPVVSETWTETYSSEIGDMVVSGPTSVTKGETFEVTFTANNFTYTNAGIEGVQGYEIEFFIDTRYVIYDTTYDTALNEVTPPWTVKTALSSNWEYTANGLTAKAYEEATDKSTASMKKITFGLGTMDPAADGLLAGDELTVTLRLKAVADGSAAFSFGCLYFSDIDWNPYYVYEYEGPCSYVVNVGETGTVDPEPPVNETWTETYSSEIGDMVVSGPTSVTKGETFEVTFTANNFTYTNAGIEGVQGYEIEFFIDTRYVIYDTTYDTALNEVTPPWTVITELSSNWEYTANGLTAKAYEEATDKSTASMKKITFGLGTMDPAADGLLAGDELTVTLRLKAVADGTAAFSFGCLYFSDIDWNPYYVYEYEGPCSYTVTVGEGSTVEPEPTTYTVTFVGKDGEILDTQTVEEGAAAIAPEAPSYRGYTFTGWDVAFDNITADTTVTAQYEVITYTVYFQDKDGNVFAQETVEYGKGATAPEAPVVEGYTFTGWDVDFSAIYGDTYVTAQYEEVLPNTYTVTFVGKDGSVIDTQTVEEGAAATAPEAPAVEGYDFAGWDANFDNITADTTVTATYTIKTFTVTFVANGETVDEQTVDYGAAATAPEAPAVEGKTFEGWDVAFDSITADTTVTAIYKTIQVTVTFDLTAKGTSTDTLTFTVDYGTAGSAITVPSVTSANAAYAFTGWDKEVPATITEDIVITAQYETTGATVTITFVNGENGTIMGTDDNGDTVVGDYSIVVSSGVAAGSAFETPDVIADDNYHFAGWYVGDELYDFNTVLEGDVTLTAKFELNAISFGDFEAGAVGTSGVANAKLYVNVNGEIPENLTFVVFYQTGDGRTSISIYAPVIKTDDAGASYIQMAIVPGSYESFDAYLVDGDIDFSAADWNVIDTTTGNILPAA